MAGYLVAVTAVVAGLVVLALVLRRAGKRSDDRAITSDELAALLACEVPAERSRRETSMELAIQRRAAAELEAELREIRGRIAVLEEGQVSH